MWPTLPPESPPPTVKLCKINRKQIKTSLLRNMKDFFFLRRRHSLISTCSSWILSSLDECQTTSEPDPGITSSYCYLYFLFLYSSKGGSQVRDYKDWQSPHKEGSVKTLMARFHQIRGQSQSALSRHSCMAYLLHPSIPLVFLWEHAAANHHRVDRKSHTETTTHHPVNFQNKTICVDASRKTKKKITIQVSLLIWSESESNCKCATKV